MGATAGDTFVKKQSLMSVIEPRSLSVATVFSILSDTLTFVLSLKRRFQGPNVDGVKIVLNFPRFSVHPLSFGAH